MNELLAFLEARIAEDEAAARNAEASNPGARGYVTSGPAGSEWSAHDGMVEGLVDTLWDCEGSNSLCTSPEVAAHMARHDPARALVEAGAKRAIIRSYHSCWDVEHLAEDGIGPKLVASGMVKGLEIALKCLANPYASHPDYQREWAK